MSARPSGFGRRRYIRWPGPKRRWAPWWLHPRFAVLFLGVPLLVLAYLIPEVSYLVLYRTHKYVDLNFLVLGLVVYGGFLAGSFFPVGTASRPQERDVLMYCRAAVWPLFVFTIFGYVVWFAYAVLRGGAGEVVSAVLNLVFNPTLGASEYVKLEVFERIPGITTFTQFGILYATVEALLWVDRKPWSRVALMRVMVVGSLTLIRGLLIAERLAIVEVLVPVIVVLAGRAQPKAIQRNLIRLAPLFLGFGVFGLFALQEYFRSWVYFSGIYGNSYLQFAAERFLGYYTTAVNNSAVVYYYEPLQPLRHTLNSFLAFPGLGDVLSTYYQATFGRGFIEYSLLLETYANYELNNPALVGLLLNEYSAILAPVVAFFIGLLSLSLYKGFIRGGLVGTLLYPSWFVGLLEISRIYYWANQRYFPVLALLAISILLFRAAKVPIQKPPPGRGQMHRRVERALGRQ